MIKLIIKSQHWVTAAPIIYATPSNKRHVDDDVTNVLQNKCQMSAFMSYLDNTKCVNKCVKLIDSYIKYY